MLKAKENTPFTLTSAYGNYPNCVPVKLRYHDGNPRLSFSDSETGEQIATVSANLPEYAHLLRENQIFMKTYSENQGMLECLVREKILEATDRSVSNGFCSFPVATILV